MSGYAPQGGAQGIWYAPPALAGGPGLGTGGHGLVGGNVSSSALLFGSEADGRATYQFAHHIRVDLERAETPSGSGNNVNKPTFDYLLRILCSRLQPGGPAHTWSERMLEVLAKHYRYMLHRWLREAYDDENLYALRLSNICHALNYEDLAAQDGEEAGSLLEVMRQSAAEFLQRRPWRLQARDAREPPLPGPVPRFMVECMARSQQAATRSASTSATRHRRSGQASAGAASRRVPSTLAAPQRSSSATGGAGGAAVGEGGSRVGEEITAPSDDEASEGEEWEEGGWPYRLPLEQVDNMQISFDQIKPEQGKLMFSPPPRNPPYYPAWDELGELQANYHDWEYRKPARMPNMPDEPQFSDEDADTVRALQALWAKKLAAGSASDFKCPKMSECIVEAFKGPHLKLTPDEQAELRQAQPLEGENPQSLYTRIMALVDINGGVARYPMSLIVEGYRKAIEQYQGGIATTVSNYITLNRIDVQTVDVKDLAGVAKGAWDEHVRRNGRPPRIKPRPQQHDAAQSGGGRDQRSSGRLHGDGDKGGAGGHQRSAGRREQPLLLGSGRDSRRAANAALVVEDSYYSAHAAQQTQLPPTTYHAVPPPRQHAQYSKGAGRYGTEEERCVTCGGIHNPAVCYVEQPHKAPSWWVGPISLPVYEAYVLSCKEHKIQPVRYRGRMPPGRAMRKEVADYLGKVGDRAPAADRAQGGQRAAGAASASGGRATGVGFMAETAGRSYPDLSDTFTRGTRMHAEEDQDDADAAYYGCYAESEFSEVAEALVSTRRSGGQAAAPAAAAQASAGSSQQRDAPAVAEQAGVHGADAAAPSKGEGTTSTRQPPAAAELRGRPPLPAPVAAVGQPAGAAIRGQATANTTAAPAAPAGRPKPPLPFTTFQPTEGTPPSNYPQPVPRHKGSPVQQAVDRGGLMQQLPVSISLHDLARNPSVSADALKQLLSSGTIELATVQRSAAQGQLGASQVVVTFSSMAEAMRLLSPVRSGFAALDQGGEQLVQASIKSSGEIVGEPEAQEAAVVAAGEDMAGAAEAAAEEGEGAAASTECAAAGHVAARLQELEGPSAVTTRPSTFELLAQTPSRPGITVALLDSVTGQEVRLLTGHIRRFIIDSGADVVLMSEECAKRNMLQLVPSNRRICTSSGQVTCTLQQVDSPVQYVLGKGTQHECAVVEETYVMPGSGSTYDILLGTPLIIKWGLFVDPLTSTATYRPLWHSQGDSSTQAQVPVLTTVKVPAPKGTAKTSKLVEAQPELAAGQQPEHEAEADEPKQAEPEPVQMQQEAHSAQAELAAVAEAAAAAEALPQQAGAQTSVQSGYEPPTSFLIMAA